MILEDKIKLREKMALLRGKMPSNERFVAEKAISENFDKYFLNLRSQVISGFKAIKSEPNLDPLYLKLVEKNIMCFPNIVDKNLIFKDWQAKQEFILNKKYQTWELKSEDCESAPDLLLIPLLAADEKGNRLGFGGGFYDRYLQRISKIKNITTVGICFEFQIVKEVPVDENDYKLDFILTDKRLIKAEALL